MRPRVDCRLLTQTPASGYLSLGQQQSIFKLLFYIKSKAVQYNAIQTLFSNIFSELIVYVYMIIINSFLDSSNMEEKDVLSTSVKSRLQSFNQLQARIEQAKRDLSQLAKNEHHENKIIHQIFKSTFNTTRNKLNLFQSHQALNKRHNQDEKDTKTKKEKVKQMRQKEERELKEIKNQMHKSREKQRITIRQNSMMFDEVIKKNRLLEIEKKEQIVKQIKMAKQNYKKSFEDSRVQEKQKKEVENLNLTMSKISRQPNLIKQLQKLMKAKQLMQSKVIESKSIKQKLKEQADMLKKMRQDEVAKMVKQTQTSFYKNYSKEKLAPINFSIMEKTHLSGIESLPFFKMKNHQSER